MYEDFYEPSEFDFIVEDLKDELRKSVKKEYTDKIESLQKQLDNLTDIKTNWGKKVAELNAKKAEAERTIRQAKAEAKRMTLHELLEPLRIQAWGITCYTEYIRDKCDKCDKDGYIHFTSPSGKDCTEKCQCRNTKSVYRPIEAEVYRISGKSHNSGVKITFQFSHTNMTYEWDDEFKVCSNVYDGRPVEELDKTCYYSTIFFDKDKAQEYCDYLNTRRRKKYVD